LKTEPMTGATLDAAPALPSDAVVPTTMTPDTVLAPQGSTTIGETRPRILDNFNRELTWESRRGSRPSPES
jgi:hypothetical protein